MKLEVQKKSKVSYNKVQDFTRNDQMLHNKERVNFETYYMLLRKYFWEQYYESIDDMKYETREKDKLQQIVLSAWKENKEPEEVYRLLKSSIK